MLVGVCVPESCQTLSKFCNGEGSPLLREKAARCRERHRAARPSVRKRSGTGGAKALRQEPLQSPHARAKQRETSHGNWSFTDQRSDSRRGSRSRHNRSHAPATPSRLERQRARRCGCGGPPEPARKPYTKLGTRAGSAKRYQSFVVMLASEI